MKHVGALAILAAGLLGRPALAATQINYWMWSELQGPAYQACAAAFEKNNPDIQIKITQIGWNNYWSALTTAMVSGTAPDVFTDHLTYYPEFATNGQIVDLASLIARDKLDTSIYRPGLLSLWQRKGKTYGLPKDWDTIAVIYSKPALKEAGIDEATLQSMTWNPNDGGSFGSIIARLAEDDHGHNATSQDYDSKAVKRYGLVLDPGSFDAFGQQGWSNFAVSDGFRFNDGPWSTKYHYDSPKLIATLQWLADESLKRGIIMPLADSGHLGAGPLFAAGKAGMALAGSWMIHWYSHNLSFPVGYALLPIGPEGRKSMFNGLADSIWSGTKHQAEAWRWVKFLGSPACQNIVGNAGIVFPAITEADALAKAAFAKSGVDASPFLEEATPQDTFLFPIADQASQVEAIMTTAMEQIFLGKGDVASVLKKANADVNALFN